MAAALYDLDPIEIGELFKLDMIYRDGNKRPIDLTGYTALMEFFYANPPADDPFLAITEASGDTEVALGADGSIRVRIDDSDTADLKPGFITYRLKLTPPAPNDDGYRLLQGKGEVRK